MSIRNILIASIYFISIIVPPVYAQSSQAIDITIRDVKGDVEVMLPDSLQWGSAKEGSIISEGSQVRTGPSSNATLVFVDSSVSMVDSFTFLTIEKFTKSENIVTTRINLSVGSVASTLNNQDSFENNYEIVTPASTVSLNGDEIKKVVAGSMYGDSERTGYRKK